MSGLGRKFKRGKTWWIAYSFRGKEYRERSHSEKESVAKSLLRQRLSESGAGRLIGHGQEKVIFDDLALGLEHDYKINGKRSLPDLMWRIRVLRKFFGFHKALDITPSGIRAYIAHRQQDGAANASINR